MFYMTLMVPYLIWNRYHMVPPHEQYDFFRPAHMVPHMYVWSPPHVRYDFFRPALKESTACPSREQVAFVFYLYLGTPQYFTLLT